MIKLHDHLLPISLLILIHNKVNVNFKNTDIIKLYWNIKAWKWIFLWLVASTITKHLNSLKVASTGNKMEFSQADSASAISFHKFSVLHGSYFTESVLISFEIFCFPSSDISLIFHLYSTLLCNNKHMCKTMFKCTFYTSFFFFKYHNQKLQFKYLSCENIYNIHDYMTSDILNYLLENWTDKKLVMLQLCFLNRIFQFYYSLMILNIWYENKLY